MQDGMGSVYFCEDCVLKIKKINTKEISLNWLFDHKEAGTEKGQYRPIS